MAHPRAKKPPMATVYRILDEVEASTGVPRDDIIEGYATGERGAARAQVWTRILSETGCSTYGLALAWGCEAFQIRDLLGLSKRRREAA